MAQGKKEEAEAVKAEVAQISKRLTELEPLEKEYQDKVLEDMMKDSKHHRSISSNRKG